MIRLTLPFDQQCRAAGLPVPVPEHPIVSWRQFAFDFAWPEQLVALEIEGGIYGRGKPCPLCKRRSVGAHTSIGRLKSDMEKYNLAATRGWRVFRCRPEQIKNGEALAMMRGVLRPTQGGVPSTP